MQLVFYILFCFTGCGKEENTTQYSCRKEKDYLKKAELENESQNEIKQLKWSDDDIDMEKFLIPPDFDMEKIRSAITSPDVS